MKSLSRIALLPFALAACGLLQAGTPPPPGQETASAAQPEEPPQNPWRQAVDQPGRPEEDRRRDADRHPAEVLEFLQIRPGMRVGELAPGEGYYTEILSSLLGPSGKLMVHATGLTEAARGKLDARIARLAAKQVEVTLGPTPVDSGFESGLDAILLIRGYHDYCYMQVDIINFNRAVYEALKPGGVFGVVDHRGAPGTECALAKPLHRIDPWLVEYEALQAGFVLEETSDLLANAKDDLTLSSQRDGGAHRDRTDRFLFRFRKPLEEISDDEWEAADDAPKEPAKDQP